MTFRSDIAVDWERSPRVCLVAAPSVELTIQDSHDTLRVLEYRPNEGATYPKIVDTAGKEDLGGGVLVGLTQTLRNAQYAFEAQRTITSSGTVTTGSADGSTLIDSAATFVTDGVLPGAAVINWTDQSFGTVLAVDSETQLTLLELGSAALASGTDNDFDVSDAYAVLNVRQVEISGGNMVAVDDVGGSIDAVFPTFGTQVIRTSSSSATLAEQQDIQHASFNNQVLVDPNNETGLAVSGTTFPTGTGRQPVDNFADALTIAASRGLITFHIRGASVTLPALDFSGQRFEGDSPESTAITVSAGATVVGCEFADCDLQGTFDGVVFVERCLTRNLNMVEGVIKDSRLRGTITLSTTGTQFSLLECVDDLAGIGTPTIDFGGDGPDVIVRGYRGGLVMQNKIGTADVSIDGVMRLVLAADFGGTGTVLARGVGPAVSNLGSFANLTDQMVSVESAWTRVLTGTVTAEDALLELFQLAGLDSANPLEVTSTTRQVPADGTLIDQTISDVSGTVTVQRL